MESDIIPPAEQVRQQLAEAVRRVRLLKALLKIAEDHERKRNTDQQEKREGDGWEK